MAIGEIVKVAGASLDLLPLIHAYGKIEAGILAQNSALSRSLLHG
jgi:hypothetical protein